MSPKNQKPKLKWLLLKPTKTLKDITNVPPISPKTEREGTLQASSYECSATLIVMPDKDCLRKSKLNSLKKSHASFLNQCM